jgi:hypothetical protein
MQVDRQDHQGMKSYTKKWFQSITRPKNDFLLQHFLVPNLKDGLVPRIQAAIEVYLPYLNMSMFFIFLHTWLHWKFSYT